MDQQTTVYESSIYKSIGGDEGVRALVREFYRLMDTLPEAQGIRKMHPENLASSEEKLYMFLSGWLGGPQLFIEKYGHPRLRMRHFPFAIGQSEADQWMLCMEQALKKAGVADALATQLTASFRKVADHIRNRETS
jgi:hemoglobin